MADDLHLSLTEDGADAERLDALARALRGQLLGLDVDDVRPAAGGPPPEGARGLDVLAVGGMLISLGRAAGALRSVLSAVREWLVRPGAPARSVRLELDGDVLELSSVDPAEQDRLVALFVARHTPPGP